MPLTSQAQAVAFDLEDTLCDHQNAKESALRYVATLVSKVPRRQESFVASFKLSEPRLHHAVLANRITTEAYFKQRFIAPLQASETQCTEQMLLVLHRAYNRSVNEAARLHSEALEVLQSLYRQQIPLALIINGSATAQRTKVESLGIMPYFSAVLISSEEKVAKPDPRIFLRAADVLNVKASDLLMVGDSLNEDYKGALNAGLQAVLLDRDQKLAMQEGISSITNLKELVS